MEDHVLNPGVTKSLVWTYFGFVVRGKGKPPNEEKPVCRECSRTIATKGNNMLNLLLHHRNSQPIIFSHL